jgi:DNA-binding NtrC family response regulator
MLPPSSCSPKGAFTGADKQEGGWFEAADGGVLFLDELQNSSLEFQAQLLDLLSPTSNAVYVDRVGDTKRRRFNVKVMLATDCARYDSLRRAI